MAGKDKENWLAAEHPLQDDTRRERRWLLLASLLVVVVTQAGVLPKKIDAFGLSSRRRISDG